MPKFRPAKLSEYLTWYYAFYEKGGRPTHLYDYPWARWNFLFANSDFRLGDECGADARHIIVGSGVKWIGGERGHNSVYFPDGTRASITVPMFSDLEFTSLPGYEDLREREDIRDRKRRESERLYERQRVEAARYSDLTGIRQ